MSGTGGDRADSRAVSRYAAIMATGWTLLIVGLGVWSAMEEMEDVRSQVRNEARAHFLKDQAFRHWGASHGGVYVPPTDHTPPNPNLSHIPDRDVVTTDGKKLTLMNPAYMIRQLMEDYEEQYGIRGRITSLKPLRIENAPDEWERAALESFERGETEVSEFSDINGEPYLRLMRPLAVKQTCLKCHGHQGYKVGDVRGAIGVSVPAEPFFAEARQELVEHAIGLGLLWLLGIAALVFGARHIRRRVYERDRAEEELRRYECIFTSSNDMMALLDKNFVYLAINESYVKAFGKTRGELVGATVSEVFGETLFQEVIRPNAEKCLQGSQVRYQDWFDFPTFGKRYLEVTYDPYRDPDNEISGFTVNGRDITEHKRAEEALKKSEEEFRTYISSAPDAVFVADAEGYLVEVNSAASDLTGYSVSELSGMTISDIIDPETHPSIPAAFAMLKRSGRLTTELKIKHKDGSFVWASFDAVALANKCYMAFCSNIAERKLAEEALRESEAGLAKAQEISHLGNWVLNPEQNDLRWSDEVYRIFGLEPQQMGATFEAFLHAVHPDDREFVEQAYSDSVKNNTMYELVHKVLRPDGTVRVVREQCEHILDEAGNLVRSIGTVLDITDIKLAEEANAMLSSAIEQAGETVVITDAEGKIQYVNPAFERITGYSSDEVIGQNPRILKSGQQDDAFYKRMWETLSSGAEWHGEIVNKKKDGALFTESVAISPVFDTQGKVVNYVAVKNDITETKRLQELESRAQRLETAGTIAGQVAHDFNNLLAPIMAYPEFIHDELPHDHAAHAYLDAIEDAAQKMAEINQDLLTMGRRGHYNLVVIDLNRIVLQAAQEMESRTKTVTVQLELCEDLMKIKGGVAQIHRMLSNLLVNAQDAMDDIGQITIKTEKYYSDDTSVAFGCVPKGEYIKLTISDSGCGIPDEIQKKILDPFFSTKTTDKKRGSGLGLSVVDAVMKDHGGYLDLSSKVGYGTSFYLYFPVTRDVIGDPAPDDVTGGDETVLIVEDDDIQREVSSQLLTKLGYKVSAVVSGEIAIKFLRHNPQDIVILDMVMPGGIDGAETYRRILEISPNQKAIILSGFSESDQVFEAQRLGAGAFVRKPVTKNVLAAAVRTELDRTRAMAIS